MFLVFQDKKAKDGKNGRDGKDGKDKDGRGDRKEKAGGCVKQSNRDGEVLKSTKWPSSMSNCLGIEYLLSFPLTWRPFNLQELKMFSLPVQLDGGRKGRLTTFEPTRWDFSELWRAHHFEVP